MSDIQWYIQVGPGKKAGPISFERLRKIAGQGKIYPTTKVRSNEAEAVWTPAHDVPGLFDENVPIGTEPGADESSPDIDLPTEEPTGYEAISEEPADDDDNPTEATPSKIGAIVIDVKKTSSGKDSSKSEKKKAWSGFMIDTSGKKEKDQSSDEPDAGEEEEVENVEEAPVVEPMVKPRKSDRSSAAIKIDLAGLKRKNTEESSTVVVSELDLSAKAKKSDASSKAVKIDFSASRKKADDSSKVSEVRKPALKEKKEKAAPKPREKKPKAPKSSDGLPGLLKACAVAAFLTGGLGAIGLFALNFRGTGVLFATVLGNVVLLLGTILGVLSWNVAGLATRTARLEKTPEEKTDENDSE